MIKSFPKPIFYLTLMCFSCMYSCKNTEVDAKNKPIPDFEPTHVIETNEEEFGQKIIKAEDISLNANIDLNLRNNGKIIYNKLCTACHQLEKSFIGPSLKGVTKRRKPEWIMNMILDPENWVKNDQQAIELLNEFDGSPMTNQGLTFEEARSVLEYLRTLN